jgi:hypothetical protein
MMKLAVFIQKNSFCKWTGGSQCMRVLSGSVPPKTTGAAQEAFGVT